MRSWYSGDREGPPQLGTDLTGRCLGFIKSEVASSSARRCSTSTPQLWSTSWQSLRAKRRRRTCELIICLKFRDGTRSESSTATRIQSLEVRPDPAPSCNCWPSESAATHPLSVGGLSTVSSIVPMKRYDDWSLIDIRVLPGCSPAGDETHSMETRRTRCVR